MYVSMRRNGGELKVPTNVYLIHSLKEFYEQKHGPGKISELVNAVLREEFDKEKNEEGLVNPLNLATSKGLVIKQERQLTLFEDYGTLSKAIHSMTDVTELTKIEQTGKVLQSVAHTRKLNLLKGKIQVPHNRF